MEPHITTRPRQATPLPMSPSHGREADPEGAFWCAAIGSGAALAFELVPDIDQLAQRCTHLPIRTSLTRPVVGQYLSIVKTLAAAWSLHTRPALLAALGSLAHFGASVGQSFALEAIAAHRADNGRAAQRVLDTLQRRLTAPVAAFDILSAELANSLAQMARASAELEADARLVTQRLQADHVHVFLLSQQASALQGKLDEAARREQVGAPPGPHELAQHQSSAAHGCALEAVRRQLDCLRAEQAATSAEAAYLQSLLPTLAPYLAAAERMASALVAMLDGAQSLAVRVTALKQLLAGDPAAAGHAQAQLLAAVPRWQALAAGLAQLGPAAP